jgi:ribosomal protein L13
MGDFVVVVNTERVTVTGTKTSSKLESKIYYSHSGYPGGLKSISLRDQLGPRTLTAPCAMLCGACSRTTAWDVLCSSA